jgi:ABC-type antimicrobial peptide transport system permease subunit
MRACPGGPCPSSCGPTAIRLRAIDPDLPPFDVVPMELQIARALWLPRFLGQMFVAFATFALVLAAVGIYGVVAQVASRGTHEIGVRVALGARRADVIRLLVGQGLRLVALGTAFGLAGALILTRGLARFLYGVGATDPLTFVVIPLALAAVALVASWLPARRAARIDPMAALKVE